MTPVLQALSCNCRQPGALKAIRGWAARLGPATSKREERNAMEPAQDLGKARDPANLKVCIVGASGKLGQYMVQHALDRGYEVAGVCREQSVAKLDAFKGRITVMAPRGVHGYSTGTAQAVLDHASPGARLVFSCGWHITRDGQDVYSRKLKWKVSVLGRFAKL